jgi:hypothetical protein
MGGVFTTNGRYFRQKGTHLETLGVDGKIILK